MNKYWLETSKQTERAIALCCTGSTIVSILSESHLDLSATETFFWTCLFPLWCNCCGDTRIVYKCCLYCSNVVAKDSGFATKKNTKNDTDTRMASAVLYTMWNTFWLKSKNYFINFRPHIISFADIYICTVLVMGCRVPSSRLFGCHLLTDSSHSHDNKYCNEYEIMRSFIIFFSTIVICRLFKYWFSIFGWF